VWFHLVPNIHLKVDVAILGFVGQVAIERTYLMTYIVLISSAMVTTYHEEFSLIYRRNQMTAGTTTMTQKEP